jgi:menaquinone-9 beta-reductase
MDRIRVCATPPDLTPPAASSAASDFDDITGFHHGLISSKYIGGSRCQIYVTPVSHDEVGIAMLSRDSHLRLDNALMEFPELQRRLQGAEVSSAERGAMTVSRRLRRLFRGRTILIGDASGSVDAITGEGLSLSFHQAVALSEALCSGDLRSYQAEHRRLARRPALMARLLLALDRFPPLRRSVLGMLAFDPPIFAKLLAWDGPGSFAAHNETKT